jgi:hypothetical protein
VCVSECVSELVEEKKKFSCILFCHSVSLSDCSSLRVRPELRAEGRAVLVSVRGHVTATVAGEPG